MSAGSFLIALAALAIGTYAMRLLGVKFGAALATKGRGAAASAAHKPSTAVVTTWMDRATVVLIAAVCATSAIYDGKEIADPALIIGVGAGILAAILRMPMLPSVLIGMGVCAGLRLSGAF